MLNNQEFFDELSVQYDSMIPFEKAIERKKELFKNLLKDSNKTIADIGCGTGSSAMLLARLLNARITAVVRNFGPSSRPISSRA